MRLPQMIGVELPSPGISTFQRMFSVSLQVVGGSHCGATPLSSGPRQVGQFWETSSCPQAWWKMPKATLRQKTDDQVVRLLIIVPWKYLVCEECQLEAINLKLRQARSNRD